ncbi:MAG: GEVED domain-containing protein, partial [Salibacteraceae bacterium]
MKKLLLSFLAVSMSSIGFSQYCSSGASSTFDSKCDEVTLTGVNNSINNNTAAAGCGPGYSDFTAQVADVVTSQTYNFSVTLGTCGGNFSKSAKIYVDWNQDFDFFDPGEEVAATPASNATTWTWTGSFTVPITASIGNTRMRVVVSETFSSANISPCGTFTWGETEDYTIDVLPPGLFVTLSTPNNPLLCNGDSAFVAANGFFGTPPYDFDWSTGQQATGVTADTLASVGAGTYTVTITDSIGDDTTATIVMTEPTAITVDATLDAPLVCNYDVSEASATGSGGTPWEAYAWDTNMANYAWDSSGTPINANLTSNGAISP